MMQLAHILEVIESRNQLADWTKPLKENMQTIINPYHENMISDAQRLYSSLSDASRQMLGAIERRKEAVDRRGNAHKMYKEIEAEFIFDFTFSDAQYMSAKNAEQREVIKDRALVQARNNGGLRNVWNSLSVAESALSDAEMAYAQCETKWREVRVIAELMSAALRVAAQG